MKKWYETNENVDVQEVGDTNRFQNPDKVDLKVTSSEGHVDLALQRVKGLNVDAPVHILENGVFTREDLTIEVAN